MISSKWCQKRGEPLAAFQVPYQFSNRSSKEAAALGGSKALPPLCSPHPPGSCWPLSCSLQGLLLVPHISQAALYHRAFEHAIPSTRHSLPSFLS